MTENDEELDDVLAQLEVAMDRREYASVLKQSTEWIQRHPKCSELYFRRAHARLLADPRNPDLSGAVDDVTLAAKLNAEEPAYRFFQGLWLFELNELGAATSAFETALALEARLNSVYYQESSLLLLGICLQRTGRAAEAKRLAAQLPSDASFYARGRMWTVADVG